MVTVSCGGETFTHYSGLDLAGQRYLQDGFDQGLIQDGELGVLHLVPAFLASLMAVSAGVGLLASVYAIRRARTLIASLAAALVLSWLLGGVLRNTGAFVMLAVLVAGVIGLLARLAGTGDFRRALLAMMAGSGLVSTIGTWFVIHRLVASHSDGMVRATPELSLYLASAAFVAAAFVHAPWTRGDAA